MSGDSSKATKARESAVRRLFGALGRARVFLSRGPLRTGAFVTLELLVIGLCVLVAFGQALLELEQIEVGGDALTVWEFARNLVLGGDLPSKLNHHTSRFGLVIPSIMTQVVFGVQATSYYIGPICAGVLLHLWVYLIGRKLSGPIGGAVGVAFLLTFEPMGRAHSQILPEAFGPMYCAFATYSALLYSDARTMIGRWTVLVGVGVGTILGYGAKEVFIFYAPGMAFLLWFGGSQGPLLPEKWLASGENAVGSRPLRLLAWLKRSSLVVPAALTLLVAALILVETILLSSATGSSNRFNVVSQSHGRGGVSGPPIREFADFFRLYTEAPIEWRQALLALCAAFLGVVAFARDRRSKLVALTLFVFFLLQTFFVRTLDPLTAWFQPHPRYLLGMVGPMAMVLGIFVGDAMSAMLRAAPQGEALAGKPRFFSLLFAASLVASLGAGLPQRYKAEWGKQDAWHKAERMAQDLTKAYRAGIPIVAETPQGKPAWAAAAVYIDPHDLIDEKGRPIPSQKILMKYERGRFLARATVTTNHKPREIRNAVAHRVKKRKCVLILRQSVRFIHGRTTFDKGCESLEDEFRRDPKAGAKPPSKSNQRKRRSRALRNQSKKAPNSAPGALDRAKNPKE